MRQLVIATHGKFASGLKHAYELITGDQSVIALDTYLDESFDLQTSVSQLLDSLSDHEVIVLTDVFGGSVNNEFMQYIQQPNLYLVTGVNLPLLIEIGSQISNTSKSIEEIINSTIPIGQDMVRYCVLDLEIVEEDEF